MKDNTLRDRCVDKIVALLSGLSGGCTEFARYPYGEGDGEEEGAEIGSGLSHFDALETKELREDEDGRYEEKPLSPNGK